MQTTGALASTRFAIARPPYEIFQRDRVRLAEWAVHAIKHQNDPRPTSMGSVIATIKR